MVLPLELEEKRMVNIIEMVRQAQADRIEQLRNKRKSYHSREAA
jgi:hypothetical protein